MKMSQINFPMMSAAGFSAPSGSAFSPSSLGPSSSAFNALPQATLLQQQPLPVVSEQTS